MLDVLVITSNNSNGIYQQLSDKYSAIETPAWSLLLAQSCRS
jgi:anaerobic magnesium-protoporphyrin IX monomethyl ester cyclase